MPTQVDICNAALSEVGTRSTIAGLTENSNEAQNCSIHWNFARKAVLREYNWEFASRQVSAALICAAVGTPENPNGTPPLPPWPWQYEYAWPNDCIRVWHQEWPPNLNGPGQQISWVGNYPPLETGFAGAMGPSSTAKKPPFAISTDLDPAGNTIKVILSNLEYALLVYTYDCNDPNIWDAAFEQAFIWQLAAALCGPLSGDTERAKMCAGNAEAIILKAKVADANENPASLNHMPDWIRARGILGIESVEYPGLDLNNTYLPGD
jgi:hypothetical protein